jgi:hypothetical protein
MQTIPYRRWSPPQSNLRIEFPPDLLDSIPMESAARGTGLLYGWRHGPEARLLAMRAWPEGRAVPSPELERNPALANLSVVGIFVYRCRGDVFLTEADLALFEKREAHLALVIAGDRAGFFVKEADGSFRTISSYEEFPTAHENLRPEPLRAAQPARQKAPGRWSWAAAVLTAVLVIPFAGLAYFTPLLPAPTIALAVSERDGQLVATWNPRAIPSGSQIEIADGRERTIMPLAEGQSSATYRVRDGDLEVSINTSRGSQSARFVTHPAQAADNPETDVVRAEIVRLEEQLRQLRDAGEEGGAHVRELNGHIDRLTRR